MFMRMKNKEFAVCTDGKISLFILVKHKEPVCWAAIVRRYYALIPAQYVIGYTKPYTFKAVCAGSFGRFCRNLWFYFGFQLLSVFFHGKEFRLSWMVYKKYSILPGFSLKNVVISTRWFHKAGGQYLFIEKENVKFGLAEDCICICAKFGYNVLKGLRGG